MPRTIITHVGASLLKCQSFSGFNDRGQLLEAFDYKDANEVTRRLEKATEHLAQALATLWAGKSPERYRHAPAEIASLSLLAPAQDDRVVLLHSDTLEGCFCAKVLKGVLQRTFEPLNGYPFCRDVVVRKIAGLRVSEQGEQSSDGAKGVDDFVSKGLPSYVTNVWEEYFDLVQRIAHVPSKRGTLLFNITAGYKGAIPIARDLALLLSAHSAEGKSGITTETCYLYEESNQLIHYGSLPIDFNWHKANMSQLERAAGEDEDELSAKTQRSGDDRLRLTNVVDNRHYYTEVEAAPAYARLSPLGRVVWEIGKRIYPDGI